MTTNIRDPFTYDKLIDLMESISLGKMNTFGENHYATTDMVDLEREVFPNSFKFERIAIDDSRQPVCEFRRDNTRRLFVPVIPSAFVEVASGHKNSVVPNQFAMGTDYDLFKWDSKCAAISIPSGELRDQLIDARRRIDEYIEGLNHSIDTGKRFPVEDIRAKLVARQTSARRAVADRKATERELGIIIR